MNSLEILKSYHLKRTACREGILSLIIESSEALSEEEIKQRLNGNFDRTTFYRSFKTLEDSGIIHKIIVDDQHVKYGFSDSRNVQMPHIHFYCKQCGKVFCMEQDFTLPKLPVGFSTEDAEVIIKGNCKTCQQA